MKENDYPVPLSETVYVFTQAGMGNAPADLQMTLALKFLSLISDSGELPAKIIFYTEGVKLCCKGSPAVEILRKYESAGVELVICKTCLDYFFPGESNTRVEVGMVGGMPDIIETMHKAMKVVSL